MNRSRILLCAVLVEAGIIAVLFALNPVLGIRVRREFTPKMAIQSPLELALEYESPDAKFEELVGRNSGWILYRSPVSGLRILEACALSRRTNHVRILLAHGADVAASADELEKLNALDARDLLLQIAKSVEKK